TDSGTLRDSDPPGCFKRDSRGGRLPLWNSHGRRASDLPRCSQKRQHPDERRSSDRVPELSMSSNADLAASYEIALSRVHVDRATWSVEEVPVKDFSWRVYRPKNAKTPTQ